MRKLWILVVCAAGCATTSAASRRADLPLSRMATGQILVAAAVNGQPVTFVLDSGASATIITPAARARLGLKATDSDQRAAGLTEIGKAKKVTVASLRVGGTELRDFTAWEAALEDLEDKIDGVLGRDFFEQHDVEIDFQGGRLRLYPRGAAARHGAGLPLAELPDGLMGVAVTLDGKEAVGAIFDLGAQVTIVSTKYGAGAALAGGAQAIGADGKPFTLARKKFASLEVGGERVDGPMLYVGDLPVFAKDGPQMILGLDVIAKGRVLMDVGAKRVWLDR